MTKLFSMQTAAYVKMLDAFQEEYDRCLKNSQAEPDMDLLMLHRKRLHDTYSLSNSLLHNHIENGSQSNSKKKVKKRYLKLKNTKNGVDLGVADFEPDVTCKMIESILRDADNEVDPLDCNIDDEDEQGELNSQDQEDD